MGGGIQFLHFVAFHAFPLHKRLKPLAELRARHDEQALLSSAVSFFMLAFNHFQFGFNLPVKTQLEARRLVEHRSHRYAEQLLRAHCAEVLHLHRLAAAVGFWRRIHFLVGTVWGFRLVLEPPLPHGRHRLAVVPHGGEPCGELPYCQAAAFGKAHQCAQRRQVGATHPAGAEGHPLTTQQAEALHRGAVDRKMLFVAFKTQSHSVVALPLKGQRLLFLPLCQDGQRCQQACYQRYITFQAHFLPIVFRCKNTKKKSPRTAQSRFSPFFTPDIGET